jgi:hypothetical protein
VCNKVEDTGMLFNKMQDDVNKIKASKNLIIARLKKLRNLNNTNIFFLMKLQEFIYLQTLKIKVDLCSDCYCDETEINLSEEDQIIHNGDRIAQLVIQQIEKANWIQVSDLEQSSRNEGGFGHSGIK